MVIFIASTGLRCNDAVSLHDVSDEPRGAMRQNRLLLSRHAYQLTSRIQSRWRANGPALQQLFRAWGFVGRGCGMLTETAE